MMERSGSWGWRWGGLALVALVAAPGCLLTTEAVYYRDVPVVDATAAEAGDAADAGSTDAGLDVAEDVGFDAGSTDAGEDAGSTDAGEDVFEAGNDAADGEAGGDDVADVTDAADVADVVDVADDVPDVADVVVEDARVDAPPTCPPGQQFCGNACVDVSLDPFNCGECNTVCPASTSGAAGQCVAGQCVPVCPDGTADCDQDPSHTCEVSTATDVSHCGGCDVVCAAPVNASPTCTAGHCGFACTDPFADCNRVADDGCEANLASDPLHCGGCATVCPPPPANAVPVCLDGACDFQCNDRFNRTSTGCAACGGTLQPCCQSGSQCLIGICSPISLLCIVG